jgi:hypothetical protein
MPKSITFPQTSPGQWTNAETGVQIVKRHVTTGGGYKVRGVYGSPIGNYPTRAAALTVAKGYVEDVVRPMVEAAHDEAMAEDRARTAVANGTARKVGEVTVKVAGVDRGRVCLRVDGLHVGHMKAVTAECRDEQVDVISDEAEGTCTATSGWTLPHPYEYNPAEVKQAIAGNDGYDEYERCGAAPNDPVHAGSRPTLVDAEGGQWTQLYGSVYAPNNGGSPMDVERIRDMFGPITPKHPAGTPEYDAYRAELQVELGKFARGEAPYVFDFKTTDRGPGDPEATAQLAVYAACTVGSGKTMLAPADLNDDTAWQEYIAALPVPSTDEYTAVLAEFGDPYGDRVAECREAFRTAARTIWHGRARGTLTDESYRRNRQAMRVARECIGVYRGLTQAWARRNAEGFATT